MNKKQQQHHRQHMEIYKQNFWDFNWYIWKHTHICVLVLCVPYVFDANEMEQLEYECVCVCFVYTTHKNGTHIGWSNKTGGNIWSTLFSTANYLKNSNQLNSCGFWNSVPCIHVQSVQNVHDSYRINAFFSHCCCYGLYKLTFFFRWVHWNDISKNILINSQPAI